ncbi:hypothetical protein QTP88_006514 [Uroleucon formosanum]
MYTSSCVHRHRRVRVGGGRLNSPRVRHWIRVTILAAAAAAAAAAATATTNCTFTTTFTFTSTCTFTSTVASEIRDIFRLFGGTAHAYAYSAGVGDVGAAFACPLAVKRKSLIGRSVVPARWVEAAGPPAGCGENGGHRVWDTPTTDAVGPPPKTLENGTRSSIVRVGALVCSVASSVIVLRDGIFLALGFKTIKQHQTTAPQLLAHPEPTPTLTPQTPPTPPKLLSQSPVDRREP